MQQVLSPGTMYKVATCASDTDVGWFETHLIVIAWCSNCRSLRRTAAAAVGAVSFAVLLSEPFSVHNSMTFSLAISMQHWRDDGDRER